jgi:hypothetical protein
VRGASATFLVVDDATFAGTPPTLRTADAGLTARRATAIELAPRADDVLDVAYVDVDGTTPASAPLVVLRRATAAGFASTVSVTATAAPRHLELQVDDAGLARLLWEEPTALFLFATARPSP